MDEEHDRYYLKPLQCYVMQNCQPLCDNLVFSLTKSQMHIRWVFSLLSMRHVRNALNLLILQLGLLLNIDAMVAVHKKCLQLLIKQPISVFTENFIIFQNISC